MTEYYQEQHQEALRYQDFVKHEMYKRGMPIVFNDSTHMQYTEGENIMGVEIKNDKLFRETGNLYIETGEKTHPDNPNFVPSGILRNDNAWLYLIGDYQTIFIFAVTMLVGLNKTGRYRKTGNPTSCGFLLPDTDARKYAAKVIEIPLPPPDRP